MLANLFDELGGRGLGAMLGLVVGGLIGWALAYWRRRRQRLSILEGDARDTLVIHQHLIERPPTTDPGGASPSPILRIRALGQGELAQVIPNDHLAAILLRRARQATTRDTLISMEGAEGSFLLETLTAFVCDRAANAPFERDLYVMAPCCEPAGLAEYQPITLLLIAVADLPLFESWPMCRDLRVEHGGDGARVLTLMAMARRFRSEQETLAKLRASGQRTRHVETMYVLDLALDKRAAPLPTKAIPWGRFESVLEQLKLE